MFILNAKFQFVTRYDVTNLGLILPAQNNKTLWQVDNDTNIKPFWKLWAQVAWIKICIYFVEI